MTEQKQIGKNRNLDGGYAWVILAASFVLYMLSMGIVKSFGILYKELLDMYGQGAGVTAFIGSIASFVQAFGAPLWNSLCVRLSFRIVLCTGGFCIALGFFFSMFATKLELMFITYSLISGLGFGLIFVPCSTLINFYFEKRRALANGIVVSASGFGALIYPYLYRFLFDEFEFSGAMLLLSGILLNCCVAAALCRQPKQLTTVKKNKDQSVCAFLKKVFTFRWELFKNKSFFTINVAFAVTLLGYGANYYILPAHVVHLGYSRYDAALCMTILGITESIARIIMGWLTDLKLLQPKYIYAGSMVIGGIGAIVFPLTSSFSLVCAYAVLVGIFPATFYTLIPIILVDILSLDLLPAAYGLVNMSMALVFIIGQPALGYLNDLTGTWNASFYAAGSILMFAGMVTFLEGQFHNKQKNLESTQTEKDLPCTEEKLIGSDEIESQENSEMAMPSTVTDRK